MSLSPKYLLLLLVSRSISYAQNGVPHWRKSSWRNWATDSKIVESSPYHSIQCWDWFDMGSNPEVLMLSLMTGLNPYVLMLKCSTSFNTSVVHRALTDDAIQIITIIRNLRFHPNWSFDYSLYIEKIVQQTSQKFGSELSGSRLQKILTIWWASKIICQDVNTSEK